MAIPLYLAMTAAEFSSCIAPPEKTAWMACHFSAYGTGLSNLPPALPTGSMVILNDRMPPRGHDPARIVSQLQQIVNDGICCAVLLDFQRPCNEETVAVAAAVAEGLACPVGVSHLYAQDLSCPVFLPPVPLLKPAEEYLAPWKGREVWLELAPEGAAFTVAVEGCHADSLPPFKTPHCPHEDVQLCVHFGQEIHEKEAVFTLKRTKNDLKNLADAAEKWGVTRCIGLWQALK